MPIEIRELNIKITMDNSPSGGQSAPSGNPEGGGNEDAIVAACVERVLEILKEKQER